MFTLNCKGRLLVIDQPIVMGILNATPDSFFKESRVRSDEALFRAEQMLKDGAAIVDIGGQSTRPHSQRIKADEELQRVIPVIDSVNRNFPELIISVDTFFAKVASEAVAAGAAMVNDVSAGSIDGNLIPTVAALNIPYVLMHMQGSLETMQDNPVYQNVTLEVFDFLNFKIKELYKAGINDIIVDPGFGFGKTIDHNFQLLNNLSYLQKLQKPLIVGLSRKATVYKTLGTVPEESLNGTTVLNTISLLHGANILRVHDVKEAQQAIQLVNRLQKNKEH